MSETTLSTTEIPAAEPVSTDVVTAVADAKGVEPTDLPPLYYAVDPEALDELFQHEAPNAANVEVRFAFADCDVVVDSDARVSVTQTDARAGGRQ